jgi:hypothetical protein
MNIKLQTKSYWFVLVSNMISISHNGRVMWQHMPGTTSGTGNARRSWAYEFTFGLYWVSCCSIFSFLCIYYPFGIFKLLDGCISGVHVAQSFSLLCDVLSTIVSLSVLLMLFFALCIFRFTASDYPFGHSIFSLCGFDHHDAWNLHTNIIWLKRSTDFKELSPCSVWYHFNAACFIVEKQQHLGDQNHREKSCYVASEFIAPSLLVGIC